ncbi:MAG TPA: LemA family protein [Patescibacteria group bacterium]|nr:LemA family protein [Patescibacteria group bacterium]
MNTLWTIGIILAVVIVWVVAVYNGLVRKRNRVHEAYSDIEVQLKRRHDLIPNVVETVKGYATHEQGVFEKVTEARANAIGAHSPQEHAQAENMLTGALKSLFAVAEAYPDLKANTNFMELQHELSDTENKVQASRRFYNTAVMDLKTALESFPSNIIGSTFGFKKEDFFDMDDAEKGVPEVRF